MNYITIKRYKKQSLTDQVNIPYGTEVKCQSNVLYYNDKPLCFITSQDCYDYFSRNDDNCGLIRGGLVKQIMYIMSKRDDNYQARWDKIWSDDKLRKYRRKDVEDYWLWNFEFYNAPVEDLEYILNKVLTD